MPLKNDEMGRLVDILRASWLPAYLAGMAEQTTPPGEPEIPTMRPHVFTLTVARLARGERGIRQVKMRDLALDLEIGDDHWVGLDLYQPYLKLYEGADLQAILSQFVVSMRWVRDYSLRVQAGEHTPWAEAQQRVLPHVYHEADPPPSTKLIALPWQAGLHIAYMDATPVGQVLITKADQATWGVPLLEIHQAALRNLRTTSPNGHWHHDPTPFGTTLVAYKNMDDGEAASRILLPDVLTAHFRHPSGPIVAAIPSRSILVACDIGDDPEALVGFGGVIKDRYASSTYPISEDLFLVQGTTLTPIANPGSRSPRA
jgi:hypothetical protein